MSYRLTTSPDMVIRLADNCTVSKGHRFWDDYQTWRALGNEPYPVPPPYELHSPEHYRAIRSAAWMWMASVVMARGYDNIESCASYYNSSVARYKAEARAMVAWRDAVNQALEALVLAPPDGVETWEQVQVLLPQPEEFSWPTQVELPLEGEPPMTAPVIL